jgi:translocation and assembly module TamB
VPRWFKILLGVLFLAVVALVSLPWWMGWALRPLGSALGVTFERYEQNGYARFRLLGLHAEFGRVRISATQIEADTPVWWLLNPAAEIKAGKWAVEITPHPPSPAKPGQTHIDGFPALYDELKKIASVLNRWLPRTTLGPGEVHWPNQTLTFGEATWQKHNLTVRGFGWAGYVCDVVTLWPETGPTEVQVREAGHEFQTKLHWSGADVNGIASLWAQPLNLQTRFPSHGWMPETAKVSAENWELPANRIKLEPHYDKIHASGVFDWQKDHFDLSARIRAEPARDDKAPVLDAHAEARGDGHSVTLAALHIAAPFATAELSAPVTYDFARGFHGSAAQLTLDADLSRQAWIETRGTVHGNVEVFPDGNQKFNLQIDDLNFHDLTLRHVLATGGFAWPRLELTTLEARYDDESRFGASGIVDLAAKQIERGTVQAILTTGSLARWLPAGTHWEKMDVSGNFSGPLLSPAHEGTLKVARATLAPLKTMDIEATWHGRGLALDDFSLQAKTDAARLEAKGTVDLQQAKLNSLELSRLDGAAWKLESPAVLTWSPALSIKGLKLRGPDGFVEVSGTTGSNEGFQVAVSHFDSDWLTNWIELPGPHWRIENWQASGHLVQGRLMFTTQFGGQIAVQNHPAWVQLTAKGESDGVHLEKWSITEGDRVVAEANGQLPIFWDANTTPHFQINWDDPFALEARTEPDSPLWAALADYTGFALGDPTAQVHLGGTLNRPQGEFQVKAAGLSATNAQLKDVFPDITDLALMAHADNAGLTIDSFTAKIYGQAVSGRAKLPAARTDWRNLIHEPWSFLKQHAEGHIEIPGADLAPLARKIPAFLAAQGRLDLQLDLAAGGDFSGELRLTGAATRPIDPLGTMQDINAELKLAGRQLEIRSWSAKLGGEPADLRGTITLPTDGPPVLSLTLKGSNLPLVRRAGLIVRSDLALNVLTEDDGVTRVSGLVTLRDCLVLADLTAFLPSGQTTVRARPPYFAVTVPPFSRWPLAVDIRGPKAVRIRTPVFTGVASASFHLGGTLGEPRAVGEVTVNEGRVLFPFATFTVQNGAARLSEADPFHPQVSLNAQARYHDYQVRMEVTGPLESPNITMSSNPPLDSAEVLLMVTSGQSPETDPGARTGAQRLTQLGTFFGQGLLLGSGNGAERLEIDTGERVSQEGRETYEFTYRLNERWALVGEYDEFDEYNAGIKWRAYVQEGGTSEKK